MSIALDRLIKTESRNTINSCQVGIEHHALAANFVNERLQLRPPLRD
jgi:hypothetical protein